MGGRKHLTRAHGFRGGIPDRQLIYRCQGEVRYFNLGWKSQGLIAFAVLLLCGWLGYSGIQLALMDERLQGERDRSEALLRSNASLAERYASAQDRIGTIVGELDNTVAKLRRTREEHRDLRYEIARLHGDLVETDTARQQSLELLDLAKARKAQVENEIAELLDRQAEVLRRASRQTDDELAALHSSLSMTGLNVDRMVQKALEIAAKLDEKDGIGGPHLAESDFAATLAASSLAASALMPAAGFIAQDGGADLVRTALTWSDAFNAGAFGDGVHALDQRFARLDAMRSLLRHLPLVRPTDTGRFTSAFGYRKDPYTGRRAFHSGLDVADGRGTPILATAAGTVTFAGRRPGYGNTVEIDHGFDIVTRFAHLDRILVKRGEEVDFRAQIGTMGSTGRSTGTHLHYEILHQENALNPMNFIRAGRDVFRKSKKDFEEISDRQVDGTTVADLQRADDNRQSGKRR